jgi:hypothetical protein
MVKTYLRYAPSGVVGVISSSAALYDKTGDLAICASLENVSVWNLRKSEIVRKLTKTLILKAYMMKDESAKAEILAIAKNPVSEQIATGFNFFE